MITVYMNLIKTKYKNTNTTRSETTSSLFYLQERIKRYEYLLCALVLMNLPGGL